MRIFIPIAGIANIILLGSLLLFISCTSISIQKREKILARLPMKYPSTTHTGSYQPIYWNHSFTDLCLGNDVQNLLSQNLELAAARARVDQAAAAYGLAVSSLIPSLDGEGNLERSRIKEDGVTTTETTISFGAALHWELDVWGRLKARKEAAALSLQEKQALMEHTALDLQSLLVESWIIHHGGFRLEQVLAEQQTTNRQFLSLTELRLAVGQGNALDVLQQRSRLAATDRNLPEVTDQKRRAANAYAVLLGRLPNGGDRPEGVDRIDAPWPAILPMKALSSPRQLLEDRPDLRAAFLALQAGDHLVAAAIADRLPRFSIGMSYDVGGNSLANLGNDTALRFVSGLLAPIFNAGRLTAKVDQRKAEVRELLALLEQAMLLAVREVEDAYSQELALVDKHALLKKEIAIVGETVENAKLRYVNGQETFLPVLVALAQLQSLQKSEIILEQELLLNRGRLLKALGAKWSQTQ